MSYREFDLIRFLEAQKKNSNLVLGVGDDGAVLNAPEGQQLVVVTDALVEGVHFKWDYFSAFDLGFKSLAVNLSDVAAMGATPLAAFISLAWPQKKFSKDICESFYQGFFSLADVHHVSLAGGDTTKSLGSAFVNVTVVGSALPQNIKTRSGAKEGDLIFVTGHLGLAAQGFLDCESGKITTSEAQHFLKPNPLCEVGVFLGTQTNVHAMMDVSDGFFQDLSHILKASKKSAVIDWDLLPVISSKEKSKHELVTWGEDYQLLFTASSSAKEMLQKQFDVWNIKLSCVGEVTNQTSEVFVLKNGAGVDVASLCGFDHFSS